MGKSPGLKRLWYTIAHPRIMARAKRIDGIRKVRLFLMRLRLLSIAAIACVNIGKIASSGAPVADKAKNVADCHLRALNAMAEASRN